MMTATLLDRKTVYTRETVESMRAAGIEELLKTHWFEIAHYTDIPLEVDWDVYQQLEEAGVLHTFAAWVGDELVGYCVYAVRYNPHYKSSLQAAQDVLFVAPAHRKKMIGYKLIKFADQQLKEMGVQIVFQHTKAFANIGPVLERQGYELIDLIYGRRLDKD